MLAGLILLSSTKSAGETSQYAYYFYMSLFDAPAQYEVLQLGGSGAGALPLDHLAEKLVHVALFCSLGACLYTGLRGSRKRKLLVATLCGMLAGAASETLQVFTGRDALTSDVILDTASGAWGAALMAQWQHKLSPLSGRLKRMIQGNDSALRTSALIRVRS